jgi:hypothetical protein
MGVTSQRNYAVQEVAPRDQKRGKSSSSLVARHFLTVAQH